MKKKKGIHRGWVVLGALVVVVGAILMFGPKPSATNLYEAEVIKAGDIKTYYQFSGMIDAIDKQMVMLNTVAEIKSLDVSEGDLVLEGDRLFTTTQGLEIKATMDGEVTSLNVSQGDIVAAGAPVLNVVNFDKLKVDIKVDEYDIAHIAVDDEVLVYVEALDKNVSGVVTRVSKEATFQNGVSYFSATIELASDEALRVGFTSEIKLLAASVENAVLLPVSALHYDDENKPYVLMSGDNGEIVKQEITVGISDGVKVEVVSGLKVEDEVLVEKQIMMPPGVSNRNVTK